MVATFDVLAVRFQRGIVTCHCWIDPCKTHAPEACPARVRRPGRLRGRHRKPQILAYVGGRAGARSGKNVRNQAELKLYF